MEREARSNPSASVGIASSRSRRHEQRAKTTRLAVVLSLFLVLLAAALLIGGRTTIGPMLHAAVQAREADRVGEIVFTMPDGTFCRGLAFENKTAELTESTVLQCPEARPRESARAPGGFARGAH